MARRLFAVALFAAACGTVSSPKPLRIAASHYSSMSGVRVSGGPDPMTCNREMITGSHILHWYCRFDSDPTQYLLSMPIAFALR